MHILKIIHGYPPEFNAGSENYSKSVCDELSKEHRISVFTREENFYAPDFSIRTKEEKENLTLYIVNNPQGKDGYRHKQMDEVFAKLVDELQPDIAYIGHLNHLSTGLVDVLNERHIPIVFMLHDYWLMCPRGQFLTRSIGKENNFMLCNGQSDEQCACNCYEVYFSGREQHRESDIQSWTTWIHNRMKETHALIDKVDLFIAPAQYLRNRFINDFGIPEKKIIYLDYGFPLDYLKPIAKNPEKKDYTFGYIGTHIPAKGINLLISAFIKAFKYLKPIAKNPEKKDYTFGYIGTHIPAKGINLLIEAFRQAFKEDTNKPRLKIFGRDNGQSTKALKKMAENKPIEFCGEYKNNELREKVFANVDAIVVPSIWAENSPLVIHEAQECHVPIITADFGGMTEYVHHHENGLLFRHRDVNSLAEQLQYAKNHPDEMEQLGKRGYLYSNDGHVSSIENHCKKLIEIFEKILAK